MERHIAAKKECISSPISGYFPTGGDIRDGVHLFVEFDEAIEKLCRRYGNVGSGYPHDPDTIAFLCNWVKKNKKLPSFARKSWETSKNVENRVFQKKLNLWK